MKLSVPYLLQFFSVERGFRGIFICFYCRKGLWTACVNRPHTDTFIDDQRGILADLLSAESGKKLQPRDETPYTTVHHTLVTN